MGLHPGPSTPQGSSEGFLSCSVWMAVLCPGSGHWGACEKHLGTQQVHKQSAAVTVWDKWSFGSAYSSPLLDCQTSEQRKKCLGMESVCRSVHYHQRVSWVLTVSTKPESCGQRWGSIFCGGSKGMETYQCSPHVDFRLLQNDPAEMLSLGSVQKGN